MSNNTLLTALLVLFLCITLLLAGCPQRATETHATPHHSATIPQYTPQITPPPTPTALSPDTLDPLAISSQSSHYRASYQTPSPDNTGRISPTPSLAERPFMPPIQREGIPPTDESGIMPPTQEGSNAETQPSRHESNSIQNETNTACHSASGTPIRIIIQAIDMDEPIFPVGLDENNVPIVLKHNVGWYIHSARPGKGENIVLWGHVLPFQDTPNVPAPFARLKEAKEGTRITLITDTGAHCSYTIRQHIWATPEETHYILPQGTERVTLVSCIGEYVTTSASVELSHRLITIAEPTR